MNFGISSECNTAFEVADGARWSEQVDFSEQVITPSMLEFPVDYSSMSFCFVLLRDLFANSFLQIPT